MLTQEGGKRTLADAPHTEERHQATALLHNPLGQFGNFHLATCEVDHFQRSHPINSREGFVILSSVGNERLGLWEKLDGRRRTDQFLKPPLIEQHLLMCSAPERADLLFLAPGEKGLLLYPQLDELFEAFSFGIAAARLPLRYCAPGDTKLVGQSSLCQADGGAQRQYHLTEGIVMLTARVSLHERSPFSVTHRSDSHWSNVKWCEVTHQLMDADFPRTHQLYW